MNLIERIRALNWSALQNVTVSQDPACWLESDGKSYTPEALEPVLNSMRLAVFKRRSAGIFCNDLPSGQFRRVEEQAVAIPFKARAR